MDTFIIFIVLGLFIILTVSLRFIPSDGFGVLEQFGKIHVIYQKPGLHFVMPGAQKMYLYHRETTLDFNQLLLSPESGLKYTVTLSISHVITDIKRYHQIVKDTSLQVELLKLMEIFIVKGSYHPNTMRGDLNNYLTEHFIESPSYPFAVSNIDVIDLDLA